MPEVSVSSIMDSSLHSWCSLAWDHFRGDIEDLCFIIADFCGVIVRDQWPRAIVEETLTSDKYVSLFLILILNIYIYEI